MHHIIRLEGPAVLIASAKYQGFPNVLERTGFTYILEGSTEGDYLGRCRNAMKTKFRDLYCELVNEFNPFRGTELLIRVVSDDFEAVKAYLRLYIGVHPQVSELPANGVETVAAPVTA